MSNNKADRTLDSVVREYMIERGNQAISRSYPRLLQIGIAGLKELYKSHPKIKKEVELDVEDNYIVILPNDFIDHIKLYLIYAGQKVAIGLNENMPKPYPDDCGIDTVPNAINVEPNTYSFYPYTAEDYNYYGVPADYNYYGYYKVFREEGYIAIQNNVEFDSVYLEYVADVQMSNGQFYLHPWDVEAIKLWLYYGDIRFNKRVP